MYPWPWNYIANKNQKPESTQLMTKCGKASFCTNLGKILVLQPTVKIMDM